MKRFVVVLTALFWLFLAEKVVGDEVKFPDSAIIPSTELWEDQWCVDVVLSDSSLYILWGTKMFNLGKKEWFACADTLAVKYDSIGRIAFDSKHQFKYEAMGPTSSTAFRTGVNAVAPYGTLAIFTPNTKLFSVLYSTPSDSTISLLLLLDKGEVQRFSEAISSSTKAKVTIVEGFKKTDPAISRSIILSRIKGDFHEFKLGSSFELDNGQRWQQVSKGYLEHFVYRPMVIINSNVGQYRMTVKGVGTVEVRRLEK